MMTEIWIIIDRSGYGNPLLAASSREILMVRFKENRIAVNHPYPVTFTESYDDSGRIKTESEHVQYVHAGENEEWRIAMLPFFTV